VRAKKMPRSKITTSPSSKRHPSDPEVLRRRKKPKITPVVRPFPAGPPAPMYPEPFRGGGQAKRRPMLRGTKRELD
jgi:hypothetical protein